MWIMHGFCNQKIYKANMKEYRTNKKKWRVSKWLGGVAVDVKLLKTCSKLSSSI